MMSTLLTFDIMESSMRIMMDGDECGERAFISWAHV